jgi:hypothetical protein
MRSHKLFYKNIHEAMIQADAAEKSMLEVGDLRSPIFGHHGGIAMARLTGLARNL